MKLGRFFERFTEGISSFSEKAESKFHRMIAEFEYRIMRSIKRLERRIYRSIFEMMFFGMGIVFIFIAAILFLRRFFSLDIILLGAAVLALYIGLMFKLLK